MANSTLQDLPPLPSYTLTPRPSMIPGVPDVVCQLLAPVIAYWVVSGFFHILDVYDLCSQYRLHTPAEVLKRNHVTRWEVLRDVILQQIIQTTFGLAMAYFDPVETIGREQYDITVWAQRLRLAQGYIPKLLAAVGLDALALGEKLHTTYPQLSGALSGGAYTTATFAPWEVSVAKFIYWIGMPMVQFTVAIFVVDTWQYFLHRAMHMNKFLYTTLHSRHHRLYVPYAYGALYNHPIEGFMLDTLGTGLAYLMVGMTVRQGMWFFTCSTIKTVDDHCGYAFPFDPLQHVTSNNATYHDVHHQSWGIKTNFSQPFFTFWDRLLNTAWTGGDVSSRYERDRIAAQKKVDADTSAVKASVVNSPEFNAERAKQQARSSQRQVLDDRQGGGARVIAEEAREEQEVKQSLRRSTRRKSGFDAKAISDRMAGTLHGRSPTILHAD
ncbi:Sphingolipid C4-hydroxylase sur2 [Exophiala xenobiotica]|uniref:Sphingolipid C4-hydroxylase sur2 n=1 Tax=Vermiconidia calcicola TaxID=1690605 RepID=A0AAV9PWT3_9PEZI|nr:Sphingolipid C4-hydroxylase sur2 [Exophiala xenobiotica]KAK5531027.1 Sphingolipid C4-hydroxylase sur2 [Vermiconidia calcicola]KAK5536278.1 Sphingolipid C4-hydroxylase sur2 [Chaetothyriales sp. CCFEE 6169]KAK5197882.1 Sphingolipid C4-hydroxylase sur2 [Exophiala xenobiotica]KAK5210220.1 Sphingolipid C4-hydroxylase sur2 [Exophiala xenobiotica]